MGGGGGGGRGSDRLVSGLLCSPDVKSTSFLVCDYRPRRSRDP